MGVGGGGGGAGGGASTFGGMAYMCDSPYAKMCGLSQFFPQFCDASFLNRNFNYDGISACLSHAWCVSCVLNG